MNHQETLALLSALKSAGVSHFKSGDTEISLSAVNVPIKSEMGQVDGKVSAPATPSIDPVMNEAATEKIKDLIETLKMDDASLLDKIFPAGAGG